MTPRPRKYDLPPNLTYDKATGRFRYRSPLDGRRTYFGRDKVEAVRKAEQANALVDKLQVGQIGNHVEAIVDRYIRDRLPQMPWSDGTRNHHLYKLRRFKRDFSGRDIRSIKRQELTEWLNTNRTGHMYMQHRHVLVSLWEWAISEGILNYNEAAATLTRSLSRKLESNRKVRTRLELEQFWQIHDTAPHWLQRAMRLSLVTLQARAEIVSMRLSDARDGYLYIIRKKVASESDMAFIRIAWNDTLERIWTEAKQTGLICPFVIHRKPINHRPRKAQNKEHHFSVTPDHVSKAFAKVRDPFYQHLEPAQRPSFHEIRSLGARLYRRQGYSTDYVQALMTHTDPKTTTVYLEGGQLEDRHYRTVGAGLEIER